MIALDEAEQLVLRYLDEVARDVEGGVGLMLDRTLELPYGWVFYFNSRRFIETGDPMEALGGNSPILVEASSGRITKLGTARPVAESLSRLERERGLTGRK